MMKNNKLFFILLIPILSSCDGPILSKEDARNRVDSLLNSQFANNISLAEVNYELNNQDERIIEKYIFDRANNFYTYYQIKDNGNTTFQRFEFVRPPLENENTSRIVIAERKSGGGTIDSSRQNSLDYNPDMWSNDYQINQIAKIASYTDRGLNQIDYLLSQFEAGNVFDLDFYSDNDTSINCQSSISIDNLEHNYLIDINDSLLVEYRHQYENYQETISIKYSRVAYTLPTFDSSFIQDPSLR